MSESTEPSPATFKLPEKLNTAAAPKLFEDLSAHRGAPLTIDGSDVQFLGGLCLQVLISAQKTWTADGKDLRFVEAEGGLAQGFARLGASEVFEFEGEAA